MISTTTLCKELLNVNGLVLDDADFFTNEYGELCVLIKGHLCKGLQWRCPVCGKRYTRIYDAPYEHKRWRALDFGGILVYIEAYLPRICCKEHGVKTADVPWAFPNSNFTRDFDYTVTWMGKYLSRSAISKYMKNVPVTVIELRTYVLVRDCSWRLERLPCLQSIKKYQRRTELFTVQILYWRDQINGKPGCKPRGIYRSTKISVPDIKYF